MEEIENKTSSESGRINNLNKIIYIVLSFFIAIITSMAGHLYINMYNRITVLEESNLKLEKSIVELKVLIAGRDWGKRARTNKSILNLLEEIDKKMEKDKDND